jgi:hypothetical protein
VWGELHRNRGNENAVAVHFFSRRNPHKSAFLVTGNGTRVTGAHIQLYQDIARDGADVGDGFSNDSAPDAYPKQFRLTDENPKKHDVGFARLALDPNGPSLHAIDDNYFPEYCLKPIWEMARHEPPSVDRSRPIVYTWYVVLGLRDAEGLCSVVFIVRPLLLHFAVTTNGV